MFSVLDILLVSGAFLALSFYVYVRKRPRPGARKLFPVFLAPVVFLAASFFVSGTRIGGTVLYEWHGFPHIFYQHNIKDVIDGTPIDTWSFVPGGMGIYLIANYVFYLSVCSLIMLALHVLRKQTSRV